MWLNDKPPAVGTAWASGIVFVAVLVFIFPPSALAQSGEGESAREQGRSTLRDPYAIQVNASPVASRIADQLDSLRRRGIPAYRTRTTRDTATYHRLRVGPFPGQATARSFARCQGYANPWIVSAAADRPAFGRTVSSLATDVVSLRPRPPRFLLGRQNAVVALLMPAYGSGADTPSTQPATLRVYTPERTEPVVVEKVTGVREAAGALEYGRAERVFVRDTAESVTAYAADIEAFSREHALSKYLVEDQMAFYDEGRMARFTLLGTLPLPAGTPELHSQPGFDYVDSRGQAVRHQGIMDGEQITRMGNATTRRLQSSGPTHASTSHTALFARPTERGESAQVCFLFFEE